MTAKGWIKDKKFQFRNNLLQTGLGENYKLCPIGETFLQNE